MCNIRTQKTMENTDFEMHRIHIRNLYKFPNVKKTKNDLVTCGSFVVLWGHYGKNVKMLMHKLKYKLYT